ncbi:MAG: ComEC/Rec2 family competence protein [Candidatus Omnitrophica bacterium]|nr:ComEC/Rec2 family competence protein [Candidatus Omnitrophota bacterium]MCF7877732.1 ComEC/Rec2 family competence protein [Candidatus Omnitrophota bacterium]MCF7891631.1 ComEC/Rec2 family competence protein [Candidatus Omnitrophota bacterium]MCF7897583.1 ComEC/Rec2 family competence protein [Candidatus Omnitrophota bacterium]MCF7909670.1 ComEC/Rec2 family competence protein [Candidatus Omnitrophota bacterium]
MNQHKQLANIFNFFIFVFLLIGIVLGSLFSSYFLFSLLFVLSGFLAYFLSKKNKVLFSELAISFLIICLGALLFIASGFNQKDIFFGKRQNIIIKVISLPEKKDNKNTFLAKVIRAGGHRQDFQAKVIDYSKKMEYLNKYQFRAKLAKRNYYGKEFYYIWVKRKALLKKMPLSFWEKAVKRANNYCLGVFKQNCSFKARNFLAAIFLGRKELVGQEKRFIQNAGLSHLLAISGLHVGLISLILFYFLRFFNVNFRTILFILSFFLVFYVAATGFRPSTQRAVIMYLVFAFSFFIKRRTDVLNSLGMAGMILLLFSPTIIYDIGFQLSFLAVFGIIIGFKIFPYKQQSNLLINYLKQIFLCSFFVTVFTLPVVSFYFGKIYLLSILYNIILIPIFTFILLLNLLLLIISPLAFFAKSLGAVLSWLVYIFQGLAKIFGSFSYSYFSYSFSPQGIFVYYFLLSSAIILFLKRKSSCLRI